MDLGSVDIYISDKDVKHQSLLFIVIQSCLGQCCQASLWENRMVVVVVWVIPPQMGGLASENHWPSFLKVVFIQFLLLYEEKSLM